MIVLDTNVVSEAVKSHRSTQVIAWLNRQEPVSLYLTAISLAEMLLGIALLDEGGRKREMSLAVQTTVYERFDVKVLDFNAECAEAYASLMSQARRRGLTIAIPDGQIAAIAKSWGFAVATRNVTPFVAAGVEVINPWEG